MTKRLLVASVAVSLICVGSAMAGSSKHLIRLATSTDNHDFHWYVSEVREGATVRYAPVYNIYPQLPGLTIPFTDNDGYRIASVNFNLPANAQNPQMYIERIWVDGRAVVALNGHVITDSGTFCGGKGFTTYQNDGPNLPRTFLYAGGSHDVAVTKGFVAATNTLTVIINNTNEGILGVPVPVPPSSPSWFGMTGGISYLPGP